ncbi:TPA: hypothetical protein ACIU15_000041 [Yersinia enterocolitica]
MSEIKQYDTEVRLEAVMGTNHYGVHIHAMTTEDLHSKPGIAVELAWRDLRIEQLIAQLESAQKERDALREVHIGAGSNTRAAADIYFQLVEELEVPAGGSLVGVIDNLKAELSAANERIDELELQQIKQNDANSVLSAALDAANEKLSKPVVLPRMHVGFDGVSTNAGDSVRNKAISDCAEAIRTAGFTADEGKDLWLM